MANYKIKEDHINFAAEPASACLYSPRLSTTSELYVVHNARKGIKTGYLLHLGNLMGLSYIDLAKILNISLRTMQRYSPDFVLDTDASSKVIQLSMLNQHGLEVFGAQDHFNRWIRSEVMDIEYMTPLSLLDTAFGFDLVHKVLGRIEHGIFA